MMRSAAACILVGLLGATASAQQPKLTFEVATIRPATPGTRFSARVLPARVELLSYDLRELIRLAFGKQVYEISVPDWVREQRFDVQATFPAGATRDQVPEMLQALLATRFGMVAHVEPRRIDAYDLVLGKGEIRMEPVEAADEIQKELKNLGERASTTFVSEGIDGPRLNFAIPNEIGSRTVTSRSLYDSHTTARRTTLINAVRISMPEFVSLLRVNLDKPIIDRTGLTGLYRFKVELDVSLSALRIVTTDVNGNPINREPTGVDTFKAVESLGLRLEERRAPIDVLVVDRIERTPTDN
jgi:uncharacterized protein (TIGR03435 family)